MDKYAAIAALIKDRLFHLGINRKEFASRMNIQPSTVTQWLSGKHNFTIDTLFKVEEVLGVQIFKFSSDRAHHRNSHIVHSI